MSNFFATKKRFSALILLVIIVISTMSIIFLINSSSPEDEVIYVEGSLTEDTTWSGLVNVEDTVTIPRMSL